MRRASLLGEEAGAEEAGAFRGGAHRGDLRGVDRLRVHDQFARPGELDGVGSRVHHRDDAAFDAEVRFPLREQQQHERGVFHGDLLPGVPILLNVAGVV
jgi:hypothetical protein